MQDHGQRARQVFGDLLLGGTMAGCSPTHEQDSLREREDAGQRGNR